MTYDGFIAEWTILLRSMIFALGDGSPGAAARLSIAQSWSEGTWTQNAGVTQRDRQHLWREGMNDLEEGPRPEMSPIPSLQRFCVYLRFKPAFAVPSYTFCLQIETGFDRTSGNMTSAPHNFSWIVPNKLAGMALPRLPVHYQYLYENGIQHLVTLCERMPPCHDTCPAVKIHHIKIHDFCAPSFEQIKRFISIVEEANAKGEGVGVHCHHGLGRTGTMLACYLVKSRNITGVDAIEEIRSIRHGSIETSEQEKTIVQFHHHIK